ncbi:hypothetical protein CLU96_1710 [Chryseobacterium sp. 52]|nr:hypothetical protein CLU96_1710 [Chryseobacterium sp. 52]
MAMKQNITSDKSFRKIDLIYGKDLDFVGNDRSTYIIEQ